MPYPAIFFVVIGACIVTPTYAFDADIVISHAKIISPPNTILEDGTIAVVGNRIDYVGSGKVTVRAKHYIDATGKTVIPGMIDAHVHLNKVMDRPPISGETEYSEWVKNRAPAMLHDYLKHGFTTILSLADYWPGILQVREKVSRGEINGPRVLISGPMISPPHGHLISDTECMSVPYCAHYGPVRGVANEEEARKLIQELAAAKVDGVKIAYEPPQTAFNTGRPMDAFAPGVFKALIDEAHAHHLPVRVHAVPADHAIEAIELGADGLAHGPGLVTAGATPETINKLMTLAKERDVPINTTLSTQTSYPDLWGVEQFVAFGGTRFVKLVNDMHNSERVAQDARRFAMDGVTLAFGSDIIALEWPGDAVKLEMKLLAKSGLSPMQVLAIATRNAARFVNLEKEIGAIEKGKRADLAIVAGDPLKNMDFLDRIDLVVKDGAVVFDYYATEPTR